MLDANRAWDLKTAIEAARRFAGYHPRWPEEPLQWYDDLRAMRVLRQHTHRPLEGGMFYRSERPGLRIGFNDGFVQKYRES